MSIPDPATTDWVPIWNPVSQGPVGPPGPAAGPHHTTHETGGTDAIVSLAGSVLTSGVVGIGVDTTSKVRGNPLESRGNNGSLLLFDTNGPANQREWGLLQYNDGNLNITTFDDTATVQANHIRVSRAGITTFLTNYTSHNAGALFPNTSSNLSLLDKYEEGSWTPTLVSVDGGAVTGYSAQSGRYTRIGNFVICTFIVGMTTASWTTGLINIAGLPFVSVSDQYHVGNFDYYSTAQAVYFMQMHFTPGGSATHIAMKLGSSVSAHDAYLSVANMNSGTNFRGTLIYRTNT